MAPSRPFDLSPQTRRFLFDRSIRSTLDRLLGSLCDHPECSIESHSVLFLSCPIPERRKLSTNLDQTTKEMHISARSGGLPRLFIVIVFSKPPGGGAACVHTLHLNCLHLYFIEPSARAKRVKEREEASHLAPLDLDWEARVVFYVAFLW